MSAALISPKRHTERGTGMIDLQTEVDALIKMKDKLVAVFPSYITHIRFPRFKNMAENSRIDFTFPITALVGANGSGKTSVLNALYGAPKRFSTGEFWFSTEVDPIEEGEGSPNRFVYGHYNRAYKDVVETRKARVRKVRGGREDPNYWEPTKESPGDQMVVPVIPEGKKYEGRSLDRWNPVTRKVLYINFRKELSAFDKYFYFGRDPIDPAASTKLTSRLRSKKDVIRRDAGLLAKILEMGDTSLEYYGRKVAIENRLLTQPEIDSVSYILGRKYSEARLVRHRLYRVDGGMSIKFKTEFGQYSEAFAGSGEVAVTSCVVQVLAAEKGTLLLLDEPEVSLHPGAQERLLAFLARAARTKQIQVVFSTHSPHFITSLPDDAIKTFTQLKDGSFSVIQETHPYAAFHRLGATDIEGKIIVVVEDRLAKAVVRQALRLIDDDALRHVFSIEFVPGGAKTLLTYRIPVLMETKSRILVFLDGDQRKELKRPDDIPASENNTLGEVIQAQVGVVPVWLIDGGSGGGNASQLADAQRSYMQWVYDRLKFLPLSSPEEIVLKSAQLLEQAQAGNSLACKERLKALAKENAGVGDVSSLEIDTYGGLILGQNWNGLVELVEIAQVLKAFASTVRPASSAASIGV